MRVRQTHIEPAIGPELRLQGNSPVAVIGLRATRAAVRRQESEGVLVRLPASEDTTATPDTGAHTVETVESRAASNQPLLARQYQQLCIGCQNVTDGILKLSSGFHTLAHILDQVLRDVLDTLFAVDHERQ